MSHSKIDIHTHSHLFNDNCWYWFKHGGMTVFSRRQFDNDVHLYEELFISFNII